MALVLGVFITWLALQGRLKAYADFATSGPGIQFPTLASMLGTATSTASQAVGGTGTPNTGYANPVLNPSTVARSQNQIQPGSTGFPLGQSAPSSGQRTSMWPWN